MLMLAIEQEFDELDASHPYVPANDHQSALFFDPGSGSTAWPDTGWWMRMTLHADVAVAAADYIGLVEVGAGLIPAGGGTKNSPCVPAINISRETSSCPPCRR